jgi:hypothetical protein
MPVIEGKLSANITLCKNLGKTSAKPLFAGVTFPISEKERVLALIEIENFTLTGNKPQQFHIEWINSNGVSIFRRQITQILSDTAYTIQSSLSSGSRTLGNYLIRVYHFRELIAEKAFRFIDEQTYNDSIAQYIGASITFCQRVEKNTGGLVGIDTVFHVGKKSWVNAVVSFKNKPFDENEELKFLMEWIAPDSLGGYNRRITISAGDSAYTLRSSISATSEKRIPGEYQVNLYLFRQLLNQKKFLLKPELKAEAVVRKPGKTTANIILCRKFDKQTGEAIGAGTSFSLKAGEKVTAVVDLSKASMDKKKKITIHWVNPENKTFFRKSLDPEEIDNLFNVTSAISAEPGNREPGLYFVKVYQNDKLLIEKSFTLSLE